MQHAVCLTGLERSFEEIGANVREGVFRMLGRDVTFFGVRPTNSSWRSVQQLLPMSAVESQRGRCWSDEVQTATVSWMHCDFRLRAGDCRLSFLQALCDLAQCEDMISSHERVHRGGREFDSVLRLRADLFWEASIALPSPLQPNTVYTPAMDCQSGLNDHLGVGDRTTMRKYLTRIRHANRTDAVRRLKGLGSEGYMLASMQWDRVNMVRLPEWMYCPHTPRNLLRDSARTGCIGRVRCRTACTSLWCPSASIKAGECECLNETCATFAAGRGGGRDGATAVLGPGGASARAGFRGESIMRQFRHWRKPSSAATRRDWLRWCVDLNERQLFHACPSQPSSPAKDGTPGAEPNMSPATAPSAVTTVCGGSVCPWQHAFDAAPGLPECIFASQSVGKSLTTSSRACPSTGVRGRFTGQNGHWLW